MKRQNNFISMGIISLFLIFTVFCMVILSLLTFTTSRSDRLSSEEAKEQTLAYYDACTKITDLITDLDSQIPVITEKLSKKNNPDSVIEALSLPEFITYDSSNHLFSIHYPYSETQELFVELSLQISQEHIPTFSILSWNSCISREWVPDLHQNVLTGGVIQ